MHYPNILNIHIEEPTGNPSQPAAYHSLADDPEEAEKRYRTLVAVMISQLTGLSQTHVRFIVSPADPEAIEAVSFWILPLFRGNVTKQGEVFHFTPEQNAPAFSIEFTGDANSATDSYEKSAHLSAYCPECGARWINAAMLQCSTASTVIGKDYLSIKHTSSSQPSSTKLPDLTLVHSASDWQLMLSPQSPSTIGLKLQKFYNAMNGD